MWIGLEDRDGDGNFNWVSDGAPLDPALNVFWDRDNPVAGGVRKQSPFPFPHRRRQFSHLRSCTYRATV